MIEPTTDPGFVNAVLNHPDVRPFVADAADGHLDVSAMMASGSRLFLRGEHGVFVLLKYDVGIWEVHTAILPAGRGAWSRLFGQAGAMWMFTQSDCDELLTRVPATHDGARRLASDMGFRLQFTTLPECRFRGELVPCEVWSLSLQDWARTAPDMDRQGALFHEWLNRQVGAGNGMPRPDDPAHNRVVGVALAMMRGGQPLKGLAWYNRWAVTAHHPMIRLVGADPLEIAFDAGVLTMQPDGVIRYAARH